VRLVDASRRSRSGAVPPARVLKLMPSIPNRLHKSGVFVVMPKMKTNRAAAKRFRPTANGFKRNQSHRRHMLTSKPGKRKRQLRAPSMVSKQDLGRLDQLLPYAK